MRLQVHGSRSAVIPWGENGTQDFSALEVSGSAGEMHHAADHGIAQRLWNLRDYCFQWFS
jgi:hypothetical protein